MDRVRWLAAIALVATVTLVGVAAAQVNVPPQMAPRNGPDVPARPLPDATVVVFENDLWAWTEGLRQATFPVPVPPSGDGAWDRIVLEVRILPVGDPWDRLFVATLGPAEVLHGTTPRADMTVRKDVTEYASLLPPGENATAGLYLGSWEGAGLRAWVTLAFTDDDPTAAVAPTAAAFVASPFRIVHLCGSYAERTVSVTFPDEAPESAVLELFTSGHGGEEFWFQNGLFLRQFRVTVDGVLVGQVAAMPYTYAFLGFRGLPGLLHGPMWWTAQQGLDAAGVHGGVGEIPPYRIAVEEEHLPLLTGERTVGLKPTYNGCTWVTSVNVLLASA